MMIRPSFLTLAGTLAAMDPFWALAQTTPTPPAAATTTAPSLERVEITGTSRASDTEERRQSTAAKIVVGREEIGRYGDSSVAEVLKRLPGVQIGGSPGRGGEIRMRGLGNGYTQILVNGERVPPGFSMDSLSPDQIERIEILRAPSAEFGARAIAGTINIVLREDVKQRLNTVTVGAGYENGRVQPGLSWTRADSAHGFNYNVSASTFHSDRDNQSSNHVYGVDANGTPVLDRTELTTGRDVRNGLHMTGRLQWKGAGSNNVTLTPFLVFAQTHGDSNTQVNTALQPPAGAGVPLVGDTQSHTESRYSLARLNGQWQTRLGDGAKLEVRGGVSRGDMRNDATTSIQGLDTLNNSVTQDNGWSTGGKYSRMLDSEHQFATGWETELGQRAEDRFTSAWGQDHLGAQTQRAALWAQDEWSPTTRWSFQAGLRWEGINTLSDGTGAGQVVASENRSHVLSPLLHAVWRPEDSPKDQVRISLTRSYRSPTLQNLIAAPVVSTRFAANGPNDLANPDKMGNPDLKPELASGIDVAFEHYLKAGGLLSANVVHRQIQDRIRTLISYQSVPWSSVPRYVARPENVGNATVSGLELEAKSRLSDMIEGAAAVDLRANISGYRSQVSGVAGPDNRLDQQPRQITNFGADYRLRNGWPLQIGGNLGFTPGFAVTSEDGQRIESGRKRVFDAYGLWTFSPEVSLRLGAGNLSPEAQSLNRTLSVANIMESVDTLTSTWTTWSLRLEMRL
ncbi:TonB-dependent receptor plug domain-containing protein [Leptothrix ochracea]|uniref:TonB-dependent receptor plug domain-containing protein n=1 Tax=Leptothrix ochracea TaxID=735331 RepID=UPI0034E2215C